MKNKLVKDKFKFWGLCNARTGYVLSFKPGGGLKKEKIVDTILELANSLLDSDKNKYIIELKNCFTLPKVVCGLREMIMPCVETEVNWNGSHAMQKL